jgi:hypothetical protein
MPQLPPSGRLLLASVLTLVLAGFAASGCGAPRPVTADPHPSGTAPMTDVPLGEPFEIARGAAVTVEGHRLRFEAVREDSRCPAGTTCVWEGKAVAAFSFVGTRSIGEMVIEIPGFATVETEPRDVQTVTRGAYRFTLLALDPYPGTEEAGPDARPVATLRVEAVGG